MNSGLKGRRALITGGASGIGQAIAIALATEGVKVMIADIAPADVTLAAMGDAGVVGHQIRVDVSDEKQAEGMVSSAVEALGGLELFVNCAARFSAQSVTRITSAEWHRTLDTNLSACVWASRAVATHMIEGGTGSILIVGSTVTRAPSYWGAAYRASKVALKSYAETLAIELAPYGIRVNMLTPGAFATPLVADMSPVQRRNVEIAIPLWHREGRPKEIAPSAVFLLSDRLSAYTTGADLVVDAGLTLRPFPIGDDDAIRDLNAASTSESHG